MSNKIVIWGSSGHALVVADIIKLEGKLEIVGFLDDVNTERHQDFFCCAEILGGKEVLEKIRSKGVKNIVLAFGNCQARLKIAQLLSEMGFRLVTVIHPNTTIASDVEIGDGTVICGGVVINPGVKIGHNVIINTSASVDHECSIGNGVHISPGVHLAGNVSVGQATWIGIGTTVIEKVKIGSNSIVGAGTLVLKDIPDSVVAYGTPAKVIKNMNYDD
jgi:UDP-N-acetylbacillosamine N-acetyltransferase